MRNISSHIQKGLQALLFLIALIVRFSYLIVAAYFILIFAYVFGFHILIGVLKGGDAGYAINNLFWYARWFPHVPIWYPVQGGGFAFTLSYPYAANIVAILIHKFTSYDLIQSFRLVVFSSYVLGAFGIYALSAWRMKNQTIGLMAALIFLALPGIWFWSTKLGYYAFVISMGFIPWGIAFFDWFLDSILMHQRRFLQILKLFAASFVLGLTFFFHPFTGTALGSGYFLYGIIAGLLRAKKTTLATNAFLGIASAFLVGLFSFLLFAFWFLPVLEYSSLAARGGGQTAPGDLIVRWAQVQNPGRLLFDYSVPEKSDQFPMPSFPRIVTYLSLLGILLALLFRSKAFAIGIIGFACLYWSGLAAQLDRGLVEKLRFIFSLLNFYILSVSYALIPIVSAFCIYAIAWLITEVPLVPLYFIKLRKRLLTNYIKALAVSVVSLMIFINLMIYFEKGFDQKDSATWGAPQDPVGDEKKAIGFSDYYFRQKDKTFKLDNNLLNPSYYVASVKDSFAYTAGLQMLQHPVQVSKAGGGAEGYVKELIAPLHVDQFTRIGLTGLIGNMLQVWGNVTDAPTINQFMYRGSLYQSMRGFSETVFFGKDDRNHRPALASDMARWIGYKYVVVAPGAESIKQFASSDWNITEKVGGWNIYQFQDYQGMATVTNRPVVLVIGSSHGAYESIFQAAAEGLLPYKHAWIVEGKPNIDDYSIEKLSRFGGIILYGYSYHDKNKAFSLLDTYVKKGGKIFIDTGWQYVSKDWQMDHAPSFFPVDGLEWSTAIKPGIYPYELAREDSRKTTGSIPFEWNGHAWGFSSPTGLRDWAKPLLTVDGKTLIAEGTYGEGRIIWSGLNLFGYLNYQKYNHRLVSLFSQAYGDLFQEDYSYEKVPAISLKRSYPDTVTIQVNDFFASSSWVLWREAYSPQWRVTLSDSGHTQALQTYRAGLGFLLIDVPKTEGKSTIQLSYRIGLSAFFGNLITLLTYLGFLIFFLDQVIYGGKLWKRIAGWLIIARNTVLSFQLVKFIKNPTTHIRRYVDSAEDE